MKIAIAGAGLAGLSAAHFAIQAGHVVKVYNHGPSASQVGSGLMHPFGGVRGTANRLGFEGMEESLKLIKPNAIVKRGILRLGVNDLLRDSFKRLSADYNLPWLSSDEVQKRNPGVLPHPGIWIEQGLVVDMKIHLKNLSEEVEIIEELFVDSGWADVIIWATGASSPHVKKVKGQSLKIRFPKCGINDPINANCYLVPNDDGFLLGATYERDIIDSTCDIEKAKSILFPKLKEIISDIESAEITSCATGIRATTPDHMPLIKQIDKRNWIFTGLGSKGLLYHALFAKRLISLLLDH